jgi:glycerophosphoryl diester phosphodiesterase
MLLTDPNVQLVIAHRGASDRAPENTLEAFQSAIDDGADALELDVHLSRDGVPVVIHDPTLARTTDRTGTVADLTWAEIRKANAGARHSDPAWATRQVRVPSLEEVLDGVRDLPLLIEIKAAEAQSAVAEVVTRLGAATRVVVAAFEHRALEVFRAGPIAVGASRRDIVRLTLRARTGLPVSLPHVACFAVPDQWHGLEIPTPRSVALARSRNIPLHVWTVDDPGRALQLWRRGVSGIITNRPRAMHELRQ